VLAVGRTSLRPQPDDYPEHLERAVRAFVDAGWNAGAMALEAIAFRAREVVQRKTPPRAVRAQVFTRDRFTCRYCGGKTIFEPVMALVGFVYPHLFPYHPNWRGGVTHPALISRSAVVDHVEPGSSGGAWLDLENLVTACNPCNSIKSDFSLEQLGWTLQPIQRTRWDGLVGLYPALWEAAGRPAAAFHLAWMRDLGCAVEDA
jgi:hypothetical protein